MYLFQKKKSLPIKKNIVERGGGGLFFFFLFRGKSNKSQAEFVSEIKELAQRAANTTSKTELESIHRQRTRLCAEYISDVSPDRKALYQQAKKCGKKSKW